MTRGRTRWAVHAGMFPGHDETPRMKIALTGATGFLGRYLVDHLAERGHTLRCWYRTRSSPTAHPAVEWIAGELEEPSAGPRLVAGCEALVHAALHHPAGGFRGGEGDLVDFLERNVVGTFRLVEAAREARCAKVVLISSCAVHEKILDDRLLDETHPLWPLSHYGAHKAALEAFVSSYGRGMGLPVCAVRPAGIYGVARPVQDSKWYGLVSAVSRGETVTCRHGGKEVHAVDVARAVGLLLDVHEIAGEVYNCCDRYVSEYEVAAIARRLTGSDSRIEGEAPVPKHEIVTEKLRSLGMAFGGAELLESTIAELVRAAG